MPCNKQSLRQTFELLPTEPGRVKFFALKFEHSPHGDAKYTAYGLRLGPDCAIRRYLEELKERGMLDIEKNIEDDELTQYDGCCWPESGVASLSGSDDLVFTQVNAFRQSILFCDAEVDADRHKPNGIVLEYEIDDGEPYYLIFLQSVFAQLDHRFYMADHEYKALENKILTLKLKVDAVLHSDELYFLSISGAQMFVTESICKSVAQAHLSDMKCSYIDGMDVVSALFLKGHNPRRSLSFNKDRVKLLANTNVREELMGMFNIPCKKGRIDLTDVANAQKFIKVICNRGMMDPFVKGPVEVLGSKKWGGKK